MRHGCLAGTEIGVERRPATPESASRKKSQAVLVGAENIFWPVFTGVLRTLGVNYPEKVGVSVQEVATLTARTGIW